MRVISSHSVVTTAPFDSFAVLSRSGQTPFAYHGRKQTNLRVSLGAGAAQLQASRNCSTQANTGLEWATSSELTARAEHPRPWLRDRTGHPPSVRALSKTGATCGREECRGPSTPQNNSLRESFCYAQDDNLELITGFRLTPRAMIGVGGSCASDTSLVVRLCS
jgi:hypothetical protein